MQKFSITQEFCAKKQIYLHISQKSSTFAAVFYNTLNFPAWPLKLEKNIKNPFVCFSALRFAYFVAKTPRKQASSRELSS